MGRDGHARDEAHPSVPFRCDRSMRVNVSQPPPRVPGAAGPRRSADADGKRRRLSDRHMDDGHERRARPARRGPRKWQCDAPLESPESLVGPTRPVRRERQFRFQLGRGFSGHLVAGRFHKPRGRRRLRLRHTLDLRDERVRERDGGLEHQCRERCVSAQLAEDGGAMGQPGRESGDLGGRQWDPVDEHDRAARGNGHAWAQLHAGTRSRSMGRSAAPDGRELVRIRSHGDLGPADESQPPADVQHHGDGRNVAPRLHRTRSRPRVAGNHGRSERTRTGEGEPHIAHAEDHGPKHPFGNRILR